MGNCDFCAKTKTFREIVEELEETLENNKLERTNMLKREISDFMENNISTTMTSKDDIINFMVEFIEGREENEM